MTMNSSDRADTLHRLVKQTLDSGAASSLADAEAMFQGYSLSFAIGSAEAHDPLHQAALLTGVALARRVFLGGVSVAGAVDAPLAVPMPLGDTLGDAVSVLGGSLTSSVPNGPLVIIGGGPESRADRFQIRTIYAGWRGGIVPAYADAHPAGGGAMPLAAMLSAALAVNEAFFHVSRQTRAAGLRSVGLSLWNPAPTCDWLSAGADEPSLRYLPSQLWLIGLGHLGQAYLWGLGLLPFPDPTGLSLVLQDVDRLTPSSESTSILTDRSLSGQKKTRAMGAWAERRGFKTSIHERLFDASFRRQDGEPPVALCGVDNALARRALDQVGFQFIVEAGLGRDHRDFRSMRLHTLPGSRAAADMWKAEDNRDDLTSRPAYLKMLRDGDLDQCGITLLAGKAVGAPFVGAVAACLALSEVLRLLHGGPVHQVIELDLQSIEHRSAIVNGCAFGDLNPGYVLARCSPGNREDG
jgi:hypothetical protein